MDPKKVLPELKPDNFWAKLEEKKWTERRDALLLLKGLADTPRIASGDFGDVMRDLRKVGIWDSRELVVFYIRLGQPWKKLHLHTVLCVHAEFLCERSCKHAGI